ncbi:hypothetical protein HPO_09600 [Hyphomonas polymorpha PS728]|uniref:Pili assembly chaperone N-terminal domain-containing protein n=1 Tax=Hyphomonas polymorpha PS728 TaxID=1280954 RepID=A0A062VDS4_9PROT|nr:fimbria/pilus periplasmic chaperone [Hyphomonas polymorpha]KCZ98457.1 hypothetical protein HPO_09600 [Hyphomonas polymorpha PS728]
MRPLALLLLGAVWFLLPAHPQGLAIAPIMIDAPAQGGAASLTISSGLKQDVTVQVRIYDWSQQNGEDVLQPARGLRFAPEIFTLRPGTSQIVRMSVPDTGGAGAWRVIVDELPTPGQAPEKQASQLAIRLRYVLAMFAGAPAAPEDLQANLRQDVLALRNPGPGWLRLHDLSLQTDAGDAVSAGPGVVYLLPGAEILLPPPEEARVQTLNYSVNGQSFSAQLTSGR